LRARPAGRSESFPDEIAVSVITAAELDADFGTFGLVQVIRV
jgi:hypothetical protein